MDRYGKGSGGALPLYSATGSLGKPAMPKSFGLGLRSQFEVSGYMILASFVFWICMGVFAFKAFQYGMIYRGINDADLDELECCKNFGGTIEDNVNFMETQYDKGDSGPYLMRLGPETYEGDIKGTPAPKELEGIPPIVTAVSTDDFYNVQALIKQWREDIKPNLKNAKFIIYDIGLYGRELELIKEHCECDIRTFRTSEYPAHVADIATTAYRPIIIQTMIEEHGSVFWISPNSLVTRASDLNQLKYRGERNFFLWQPPAVTGLIAYTHPKMFEYLKESRCCYQSSGMVDVSAMVFYRSEDTWNHIMKPWLKCALTAACISPPRSRYAGCFEMRAPKTTGCHRYDQSALTIIMERVYSFNAKADKFVIPRMTRLQEEYVEYFPEQPWTFTSLFFVSIMPFTVLGAFYFLLRRRRGRSALSKKNDYRKR